MLAQQVKRERRPPRDDRFPPRGSPQLVLPSGRQSLLVLRRVSFPYSSWVSRAGAAAAGFPRPEGADISQQNSAFAAVRQGRRIPREHQSLVTVRTVLTPAQSAQFLKAQRCGGATPPRTGTTLSSESGHASRANNSGGSTKCEIAVSISALVYAEVCGGGGHSLPPHAGPPILATAKNTGKMGFPPCTNLITATSPGQAPLDAPPNLT
jgi:hypothetical protein